MEELFEAVEQGDKEAELLALRIMEGENLDPEDLEEEESDSAPRATEPSKEVPESEDSEPKSLQKFTREELASFLRKFPDLTKKVYGSKELEETHFKFKQISAERAEELMHGAITLYPEQFNEETKNFTWQQNHNKIRSVMHNLIVENRGMPTTQDIAERAGLSRMTVNKHLSEMKVHPMFDEELKKFEMLQFSILTAMAMEACNGNVKAARLYFEIMGNSSPAVKNQTNNFLTVNNLTITREDVEKLPEDKQQQLISLFKKE